jgi:hypothetical protein
MGRHRSFVALIALPYLLLAGCARTDPPESSPAATTAEPSASASAPATPASPAPDAALRVVAVSSLEVADLAGAEGVVRVTPATLHRGERVWVLESAELDGRTHHLVVADRLAEEAALPFGWVPDTVGGVATLAAVTEAGPASPVSVAAAASLGLFGGLACYGAEPIELIGFTPVACGAGGSPRTGTPEWLNGTWTSVVIGSAEPTPPDFAVPATFAARAAPDAEVPAGCGSPGWYRFRGHFDDPASATCRTETVVGLQSVVVEAHVSELVCRTRLVLTGATACAAPPPALEPNGPVPCG